MRNEDSASLEGQDFYIRIHPLFGLSFHGGMVFFFHETKIPSEAYFRSELIIKFHFKSFGGIFTDVLVNPEISKRVGIIAENILFFSMKHRNAHNLASVFFTKTDVYLLGEAGFGL